MKKKLPNIILIVMDTVGAKHMSLYGYHRKTTPNLERIAEECTLYTRCFAPSCWTIPSHASMFTGLYPSQHGAYEGTNILNENVQHLATVLKMMGYHTWGISSNGLVSPDSGLCRDFDYFLNFGANYYEHWINSHFSDLTSDKNNVLSLELQRSSSSKEKLNILLKYIYDNRNVSIPFKIIRKNIKYRIYKQWRNFINADPLKKSSIYSEKTVSVADDIVSHYISENSQPFFLFINLMEAHDLYRPPLRWRQFSKWNEKQKKGIYSSYCLALNNNIDKLLNVYCNLYDDEIYYLDNIIKRIYDINDLYLKSENTIFIITSDHGEHLGEKGYYGHLFSLYNELIWVPLIIKYPKDVNKKGIDGRLVSLNDIYSTVLDLVESPLPHPASSISLIGTQHRELLVSQHIFPEFFKSLIYWKENFSNSRGENFSPSVFSVITVSGLKIIESRDGSLQIFNLSKDPDEKNDLLSRMSEESVMNVRSIIEACKNDTSYPEALDKISQIIPVDITETLP